MTSTESSTAQTTTLVVGATGNTGKHVVQFLLDQKQTVRVICRSQAKMLSLLKPETPTENLKIIEGSILDLTEDDLKEATAGCDGVVSCLGHTIDSAGLWGRKDRRLVTNSVQRLTKVMPTSAKFILMGSDGVAAPGDNQRGLGVRFVIFLLRHLMNPHVDNEEAQAHLLNIKTTPEWCVVRPTNLIDGPVAKYTIYSKPPGSIFSSDVVSRSTVGKFMVDLLLKPAEWTKYKFQHPVIHDVVAETTD